MHFNFLQLLIYQMVATQGGSKMFDICEQQLCQFLQTSRDHIWLIRLFALRFCATSLFTPFYTGRWTFPIKDIVLPKDNDTSWGPYSFSPAIMHAESTSVMMLLVIFDEVE